MKKLPIIGAGVIAAALLIPPIVISNQVDDGLQELIKRIDTTPFYTVELKEYNKGWFSNSGELTIHYEDPMASMQPDSQVPAWMSKFSIPVEFNISNGLLNSGGVGLSSFELNVPATELREHITWQEGAPLYQVNGKISLSGNLSFTDKLHGFDVKDDKLTLEMADYQGVALTRNNQIEYIAELPKLTAISEKSEFITKGLKISTTVPANVFDLVGNTLFYDSEMSVSLAEMSGHDKTEENASLYMTDLLFSGISVVDEANNVGEMALTYKVGHLDVTGWIADDLDLSMTMANLDLDFVQGFQDLMSQFEALPQEQVANATMGYFQDNLLSVLSYEPEFNITAIKATIPQGKLDGYINTKLTGVNSLPHQLNDMQFWLTHMLASSELVMDKAVMSVLAEQIMLSQLRNNPQAASLTEEQLQQVAEQQSPQMIQNLLTQGFIIEDAGMYKSTVNIEQGVAKVNDLTIPLTQ